MPHPNKAISGRGATTNRTSTRFNTLEREPDGDFLDYRALWEGRAERPKTTVTIEHPKTIISYNSSPDIGFDRSINTVRGCEHGCIYCFARPSHAWHDLSPGLDFETKLFAKPDAALLLRAELMKPGYRAAPLAMGTNTDPYQPIERDWRITRQCIEVLAECRHPLFLTTKSDRLLRDIDLLARMAKEEIVAVTLSITTLDPRIARTLEPRAPHPERRIAAVRALSEAGIAVHVNIAPVIPAITDHEMDAIIARVTQAGATGASFIPVRLPHEVAPLFRAWLDAHYPDRAAKVMAIIRDLRGGRDNDPRYHDRMKGQGVWADLLRTRFRVAVARHGLPQSRPRLRSDLFRPPDGPQYSLF
ncbi:MAG: PA0069 family radical SAM protein [Sphingobium sp.]